MSHGVQHPVHYRPEIDGLRALAVLAILVFHAGLPLPGGYLGVDVFFVISGFLITLIVKRRIDERQFSVLGFYGRRVARILPALLLMLVVTCAVGSLVLLPGELQALSSSAAAAAAFASNIFFWREAAYFGGMAEGRPLLHTWSLGVEEQFYLLYPLFLLAALKWLRLRNTQLLLLWSIAGSLALCFVYGKSNPVPVFYLLPGRIWELGIGALAAISGGPDVSGRKSGAQARHALGWLGLSLIVAAFALADADQAQGLWAVGACLGAVLVLLCARDNAAGSTLSFAPLRTVGLISYSLYLWHWPILSLYRTVYGNDLNPVETTALVAAALVVSFVSFHVVERPLRRRYNKVSPGRIVTIGIAASAIVVLGALMLGKMADTLRHLPPEVSRVASFSDYWKWNHPRISPDEGCVGERRRDGRKTPCSARAFEGNVLLAGDSHAGHIVDALRYRFPAYRIVPVITKGCRSLMGDPPSACTHRFDQAVRSLVATGKVRIVVLAAQWHDDDIVRLPDTIGMLRSYGVRVTVIGPVVEYDGEFPRIVARAMLSHNMARIDGLRRHSRQILDRRLAPAVRQAGAQYFSAYDRECPNGRCRIFSSKGEPIHFDYGHYTQSGSIDIIAGLPRL